ncbi:HAD-IIIA family hydrolase [Anaerorhabdus sp.]|uniref:HAD-IIIA family hydrolase n=2 Tax=Anaerorhabdus sp. TaxID=1872524 RepID=UPI002FCA834C
MKETKGIDNMKIAFLDRDGTIIEDYPDKDWTNVKYPDFLEGSIDGLSYLQNKGYQIIIITNQYIIQDGIIDESQFFEFHQLLIKELENKGISILDTFYCPHNDQAQCQCKKPKTGLIDAALIRYPEIDLSKSILIGDSECDADLAARMNISFYSVNKSLVNKSCAYIKNLNDIRDYL